MNKHYIHNLLISIILGLATSTFAQLQEEQYDVVLSDSTPEANGPGPNGEVFTPKGDLKVLTIFAGFDDGEDTGFDEEQNLEGWSYNAKFKF